MINHASIAVQMQLSLLLNDSCRRMAASAPTAGVKPALKHSDDAPTKSKKKKARVGGIQWDEPTIAEHDKERGTRMKIEEPDTPFNHSSELATIGQRGNCVKLDTPHSAGR